MTLKVNASFSKDQSQRAPSNLQNIPVCLPFSEKASLPHQTRLGKENQDHLILRRGTHLSPAHQGAPMAHADFRWGGRHRAYLTGTVASQ